MTQDEDKQTQKNNNRTHNTKKMSNAHSTKKPEVNPCAREFELSCIEINTYDHLSMPLKHNMIIGVT